MLAPLVPVVNPLLTSPKRDAPNDLGIHGFAAIRDWVTATAIHIEGLA